MTLDDPAKHKSVYLLTVEGHGIKITPGTLCCFLHVATTRVHYSGVLFSNIGALKGTNIITNISAEVIAESCDGFTLRAAPSANGGAANLIQNVQQQINNIPISMALRDNTYREPLAELYIIIRDNSVLFHNSWRNCIAVRASGFKSDRVQVYTIESNKNSPELTTLGAIFEVHAVRDACIIPLLKIFKPAANSLELRRQDKCSTERIHVIMANQTEKDFLAWKYSSWLENTSELRFKNTGITILRLLCLPE